jgi:hypothetical protein
VGGRDFTALASALVDTGDATRVSVRSELRGAVHTLLESAQSAVVLAEQARTSSHFRPDSGAPPLDVPPLVRKLTLSRAEMGRVNQVIGLLETQAGVIIDRITIPTDDRTDVKYLDQRHEVRAKLAARSAVYRERVDSDRSGVTSHDEAEHRLGLVRAYCWLGQLAAVPRLARLRQNQTWANLDEIATLPVRLPAARRSRRPILGYGVVVGAGLGAGALIIGSQAFGAREPPEQVADFSNPANGFFADNQHGVASRILTDGTRVPIPYDYKYQDGALVFHVRGPYPSHTDGQTTVFNISTIAAVTVPANFAVELAVQATRSAANSRIGISFGFTDVNQFTFSIDPGDGFYNLWSAAVNRRLAEGWTNLYRPLDGSHRLGMEVRGSTVRGLIDGSVVTSLTHPDLNIRYSDIRLYVGMIGPPQDGDVEVKFRDFRLSPLGLGG